MHTFSEPWSSYEEEYEEIHYDKPIPPTLSLVQKWFRKEKGIHICIDIREATDWYYALINISNKATEYINDVEYKTYEQALLASIDKCIELLKQ